VRCHFANRGIARDDFFELETRIIEHVRHARRFVNGAETPRAEAFESGLSAVVPISVDRENEPTAAIDQCVIDTPGINADRSNFFELLIGLEQAGARLCPKTGEIPIIIRSERAKLVLETVNFGERETILGPRSYDDAATRGSEIDGNTVRGFHCGEAKEDEREKG